MDEIVTIPGVEIVAVCDAYTGRAQRARERTGDRPRFIITTRKSWTARMSTQS